MRVFSSCSVVKIRPTPHGIWLARTVRGLYGVHAQDQNDHLKHPDPVLACTGIHAYAYIMMRERERKIRERDRARGERERDGLVQRQLPT